MLYESGEEENDLFLYILTSPTPSPIVPLASALNRPPIPKVYSRRQQPPGKRSCTYPIASYVSYDQLSSLTCLFVKSLDSISIRKKTIGCKCVFAIEVNSKGSIAHLRACLVAKGFAQTYGVNYFDTFSLVAKLTFVRLFISIAASQDWPLHQLDIKNVLIHDDLQKEVYKEQPLGWLRSCSREIDKVCHLRKSLYGLKQSPRVRSKNFGKALEQFGMKKRKSDHSFSTEDLLVELF
ncbi:Cysteine-rich RLK (RECEPTOR-like protein kinase) 8 [Cucumis melo var. makuwa]|uniref:Cysteine-rich RLK (RECEPTOR-like protein kinase) 8 n=1 Tax=Cucumis melo var. makuwa TaxID=1194695 RepID=A0A5D3E6G9_CUCMM|nr:Cysteine-rich RLK (RECEPTOR-like protein kinase) 8 [Cucumis melo var. makuwa]